MRIPKPVEGVFPNTMAYARWGDGPKTVLVAPGGPGNEAPNARTVRTMAGSLRPLVERGYTLWMVTRRRGMHPGHTIEDMADDYADLIVTEFDGKVDLYVGLSYGGAIGIYLAANHPERFDHIALVGMAHTAAVGGLRLDHDYATILSQGHRAKAGRLMTRAMLTGSRWQWTAPVLGTLMGAFLRPDHDEFASDLMVEAEAELEFDARSVLSRIEVPVLIVGGDEDFYIPVDLFEETSGLIPDCTLRIHEGKGHVGTITGKHLAQDIFDFVGATPAASVRR